MRNFSKRLATGSLTLALVLFRISAAQAAPTVTLRWDPAPGSNIAGYRLYYGTRSGVYTQHLDLGNTTTSLVSNLREGQTYFFAVSAYTTKGESVPSHEVSYTVPISTSAAPPPPSLSSAPAPPAQAGTPTPGPVARTGRIMPPSKLDSIRDMQARGKPYRGSVQASAYARWCRGEP